MSIAMNIDLIDKVEKELIKLACASKTVTMETLGKYIGIPPTCHKNRTELNELLDNLSDKCIAEKRPDLTALVVKNNGNSRGIPGRGYWAKVIASMRSELNQEQIDVLSEQYLHDPDYSLLRVATTAIHGQIFRYYNRIHFIQVMN